MVSLVSSVPAGRSDGLYLRVNFNGGLKVAPFGPQSYGNTTAPFGGGGILIEEIGSTLIEVRAPPDELSIRVPLGIFSPSFPSMLVSWTVCWATPVLLTWSGPLVFTPLVLTGVGAGGGVVVTVGVGVGSPPPPPPGATTINVLLVSMKD